jgi:hypothetical protein
MATPTDKEPETNSENTMSKPVEVKLSPAVFQSLKESLFDQGGCQHDEVLDALHEEATKAARGLSLDNSIEPDTLNDDQWEELIGAYKSGFWKPTTTQAHTRLQAECEALKAQIAAFSAALADMTFSAPSAPDARFPGMFVPRTPTLSLNHLPLEEATRLCDPSATAHPAVIGASSDGAIFHIGDLSDDIETEFAGFSEAFRNIVLRLTEAGYNYVRFDATLETVESFPTFDW